MNTHLRISLPGYDVKEATPEQCAVDSFYNTPKIDSTKNSFVNLEINFISEPPASGTPLTSVETIICTFPHEYTYQPKIWLHCDWIKNLAGIQTSSFGPGAAFLGGNSGVSPVILGVKADSNNYWIYVNKTTGTDASDVLAIAGTTVKARLYIFAEDNIS